MIDDNKFGLLAPRALAWAKSQEELILKYGSPLGPTQSQDAERAGVQDIDRIRVLVVDRIPMPEDEELADAARRAQIITEASQGIALGHGIAIRASSWQDRTLLVHCLVHVAQCERSGGLDAFVPEYLSDRNSSADFSIGSLEEEARGTARDICEDETARTFARRQS
ncbi:MAG: hypothetical protein ABI946_03870 [Chthoniobacterales bacterium]